MNCSCLDSESTTEVVNSEPKSLASDASRLLDVNFPCALEEFKAKVWHVFLPVPIPEGVRDSPLWLRERPKSSRCVFAAAEAAVCFSRSKRWPVAEFIDKNVQPWGGDPSTASKFFKQFKSVASKLGYTPFINGQVVIGLPQDLLQASLALTQAQLTDDLNEAQVQHPQTPSQAQDAQEGEEKETQDQPAGHGTDTTPAQAGSTHPTPPSSTIEFKQGVDVRKIIQDFDPSPPTSANTAAINPSRRDY